MMNETKLLQRIAVNPNIFSGKPIIHGRRLAVEHVLGMLAAGDTPQTVSEGYPWLEPQDIQACLVYARRMVGHERMEIENVETVREAVARYWGWPTGQPRAKRMGKASDEFSAAGHDVIWSGAWPQNPGDEEILALAHRDARVMVTLDKNFGELATVHGSAHSGILRLVNISAKQQASGCLSVITVHGKELEAGAIVTAGPGRLRVRPPDVAE